MKLKSIFKPKNYINNIKSIKKITGILVYSSMLFQLREIKPSEIQAVLDLKNKIFAKKKL